MNSTQWDIKSRQVQIISYTLLFFILIIVFSNSLSFLGRSLFIIIFFIATFSFIFIQKGKIFLNFKEIQYIGFLLIIYNLLISFINLENFSSIYNGFLLCGTILFSLLMLGFNFSILVLDNLVNKLATITKVMFIVNIIILFFIPNYSDIWISSTSFLFFLMYFIYLDKKTFLMTKIFFSLLWIMIAYVNQERTFLLLVPLFLILMLLWPKLLKYKKLYFLSFLILILGLILIPVLYVYLSISEYRSLLDNYAIHYTNSRFFSYRDVIWRELVFYYLNDNIIFGSGHHLSPEYVFNYPNSAHNTYITLLTRTGVIGILLFVSFLFAIWRTYYKNNKYFAVKLSSIYLIISLLKQSSEVSLIGNNLALGILNWIIIFFGLIYVNSSRLNDLER